MTILSTLALLPLLVVLMHSSLPRQQTINVRVNDDAAGKRQAAPWVVVDRAGIVYVAWVDTRNTEQGEIFMSRSVDGGRTFTMNTPVYSGGKPLAGLQRGPRFVVDGKGSIHMIWQDNKGVNDVFYSRSTDGGATFTPPAQISGDGGEHNQDFPSIAVDSSDNLYVAFVDDREPPTKFSPATQIYFTKSTDGGETFSPAIRASVMPGGQGGSCECCNTDIAVSPDGHVYISFRSNVDDSRDIWIARSLDGGTTFSAIRAASESWNVEYCPMTGSAVALDGEETAHIVWRDSRSSSAGKDYIYYTTLRFGDDACAPDMIISDSPGQCNYPSIAITPSGAIYCAFQDTRNDASDIYQVYSLDGGNTFTMGTTPSNGATTARQELVRCAAGPNGVRYAVWQDGRRDAGDIVLAPDTSALALVSPAPVALIAPARQADITQFAGFAWNTPETPQKAGHVIYDLTYEHNGTRTDVPGIRTTSYTASLEPGTYRWWVVARTLVGSSPASDTFSFTLRGTSAVDPVWLPLPSLDDVVPNPVGSAGIATVRLSIPTRLDGAPMTIALHDLLGRRIRILFDGRARAGRQEIPVDCSGAIPGYYRYTIVIDDTTLSGSLLVRH